jgi:two-component system, NarL family, sensor histidine kinase DesK
MLGWAVREAVTNVVRHSGATSCRVRFSEDRDRVAVEVSDDGAGVALADDGRPGQGLAVGGPPPTVAGPGSLQPAGSQDSGCP